MKIELNRDWNELSSVLISRRVRFVLIGGHAVAGHAEPRLTEDLDVFGREALLKNERASGRDKDLHDVALLEEHAAAATKKRARARRPKSR